MALNTNVVRLAMTMTLKHMLWNKPGDVWLHSDAATEATNSSVYIPAAAVITRCHLDRNLQLDETSTYVTGSNRIRMMPASRTEPPNFLQAAP